MSSYLQDCLVKNMVIGIKNSKETMDFLREQIQIIYKEEKEKWFSDQKDEERNVEFFCEFYRPTEKKAEKYIDRWFTDLSRQGGFKINDCPHSIISSFDYMIDTCLDYIIKDLSCNIVEIIMEDLIYEEEKNYEAINLSK